MCPYRDQYQTLKLLDGKYQIYSSAPSPTTYKMIYSNLSLETLLIPEFFFNFCSETQAHTPQHTEQNLRHNELLRSRLDVYANWAYAACEATEN